MISTHETDGDETKAIGAVGKTPARGRDRTAEGVRHKDEHLARGLINSALTLGRDYDNRERELQELQAAEDKKDPHQQNC